MMGQCIIVYSPAAPPLTQEVSRVRDQLVSLEKGLGALDRQLALLGDATPATQGMSMAGTE